MDLWLMENSSTPIPELVGDQDLYTLWRCTLVRFEVSFYKSVFIFISCKTRIRMRETARHHKHRCILNFKGKKWKHMEMKDLKGTFSKLSMPTHNLENFNVSLRVCVACFADHGFNTVRSEAWWKVHRLYSLSDFSLNPGSVIYYPCTFLNISQFQLCYV